MEITLDQARVLESIVRTGTVARAAAEMKRRHTALIYAIRKLEEQVGVVLFDRSGHRNRLTPQGEIVLRHCRELLQAKERLEAACRKLSGAWEPSFKLIYDEVVNFEPMADAIGRLGRMNAPTEIKVFSGHLNEVESLFEREAADMMVTILPFQRLQIPSIRLKPIEMRLVAHRRHPLSLKKRGRLTFQDLSRHTFVAIKPNSGQVGLGTEQMSFASCFYVPGFIAKKIAILKRLGFGWLPDYLIEAEVRSGMLQVLRCDIESVHTLHPRLFYRSKESLGPTASQFVKTISTM